MKLMEKHTRQTILYSLFKNETLYFRYITLKNISNENCLNDIIEERKHMNYTKITLKIDDYLNLKDELREIFFILKTESPIYSKRLIDSFLTMIGKEQPLITDIERIKNVINLMNIFSESFDNWLILESIENNKSIRGINWYLDEFEKKLKEKLKMNGICNRY